MTTVLCWINSSEIRFFRDELCFCDGNYWVVEVARVHG